MARQRRFLHPGRDTGPFAGTAVILWHGAGGDVDHTHIKALASALPEQGASVVRARFPYRVAQKKAPDRMPKLMDAAREMIVSVRETLAPDRLILGGRSMGGRVASMLAAEGDAVDGLIFLSYPLHPAGKEDRLRDEHLPRIDAPMLFLQGDRDALCKLNLLEPVLERLGDHPTLVVFPGGDHSMRKVSDEQIVEPVVDWLERTAG